MFQLSLSESAQLEALRQGDELAFEQLVQEHHGSMVRIAQLFVDDRVVAEEVAQEAWLGLLKGLHRFEGRSSIKTWLFTIVSNLAKTRGKREKRSIPFSFFERYDQDTDDPAVPQYRFLSAGDPYAGHWAKFPALWEGDPVRRALNSEMGTYLDAAVRMLPDQQQMVLTLRDIQGWSADEVCNALGIADQSTRPAASGKKQGAKSDRGLFTVMLMKEAPHPELTCRELVEMVTDYFEDALSPEAYARVVEHLAECEGCDRYVAQLRETIGAVGTLKEDEVPRQTQEKLWGLFREWKQERTGNQQRLENGG